MLTPEDLTEIAFTGDAALDIPQLRYYNQHTYAEARFFRHRQRLAWEPGLDRPQHIGIASPTRIRVRHYQYRSPEQLQRRIATRIAARKDGFAGWDHAANPQWTEYLRPRSEMFCYTTDDALTTKGNVNSYAHKPHVLLLKRIFHGLGSAMLRRLQQAGFTNFITRTSGELDLRNQQAVADFLAQEKPDYVILAAAKVGGINANNIYRAKEAGVPEVEVWGTGTPRREFLHVDDLADACYWLLENYNEPGLVNVGTGTDLSIRELAELVQRTVGYEGIIRFNTNYPDGTPRKLMDVGKLASHGWVATIGLEDGVAAVYADAFKAQQPA
nr:putative GDP-L-fucose synthase 2 [Tanacetum cinerariifolium]